MNELYLLYNKDHNTHYLNRYLRLITVWVNNQSNENIENHHILPKAKDLFPEYKDIKKHPWNNIKLTYRQHFIAHWLLWKAYGKSQAYAFAAMCKQNNNRNKTTVRSSKIYQLAKQEANSYSAELRKGYAIYIDQKGNKVRCKTDDPRVINKELVSTSAGRKFAPRTLESRARTSKSNKGRKGEARTAESRIAKRKIKEQLTWFYNPINSSFLLIDHLYVEPHFIKVFGKGKRVVFNSQGKYRRIVDSLNTAPPGYDFDKSVAIKGAS